MIQILTVNDVDGSCRTLNRVENDAFVAGIS